MQDETYLADLILKDIKQMEELAKSEGVRAYLRKPPPPQRRLLKTTPNRNFLQKTLLNVAYRNQKTEEELLWKAREKQLDINKTNNKRKIERRDRNSVASLDDRLKSKRRRANKLKLDSKVEHLADFDGNSLTKRGLTSEDCEEEFIGPQPLEGDRIEAKMYGPQKPSYLDRCSDKEY